jgi:hypothetical protein
MSSKNNKILQYCNQLKYNKLNLTSIQRRGIEYILKDNFRTHFYLICSLILIDVWITTRSRRGIVSYTIKRIQRAARESRLYFILVIIGISYISSYFPVVPTWEVLLLIFNIF